jgi:GT2 family glycosyltransferase
LQQRNTGRKLALSLLDIVIVNYNSTDHLLRCLESIRSRLDTRQAEILVVDNASTDHWDRVASMNPDVRTIRNATNVGFAKAVNLGIREGTSPYVLLVNPDALISEDFFREALDFMEQHPDVGILGPRILNPDGSIQGSARAFPSPLTAVFGRTSLLTRLFPNNPISRRNILTTVSDGRNAMPVDWVSGACMVVRRKALEGIGLMDERFFMYWEDADWCKRAWETGWKVVYYPVISVIHYVGISSRKGFVRSAFEFHRSAFNLYRKHATRGMFLLMSPLLVGGLSLRFLMVLLRGQKS